ncbi:hypothetical protein CHS0354_011292 [Potamilus streckersoni]|uniref:G-protein coupled receptors family 1 profile domain-containing protein n=1 Tax=Potamilus streckersoni TaxID=2493646 RepID=A0AAE0VSE1_9BIVA|nr:hypothetical protein CHS0354_011292 [Potamilus streckersoni]
MEGDFESETLRTLSSKYADWHGYISLVVCALGVPLNLINITVLTRKHMQTPINCILTWLAVSDMLTMISYIPFAIHFYCEHNANTISAEKNSRKWMQFLVVYLNFSATTHTISIWLGVALAIFRYRHIQSPAKGNLTRMRRLIRARLVVCAIYIGSIILMIPNYVSYNLIETRDRNTTLVVFERWKLGTPDVKPVVLLNLVLYSVVAKLVPCILMIVYGGLLLRTLNHKLKVNRRRLSGNSTLYNQRTLDTSRTTVMLLIVLVLFLITELPQAILILLCIFLRNFFDNVYIPLGDTMDIIALINSGIDFVLYCSMSQEFRKTFLRVCCSISRKSSGLSKNTIPFESLHTTQIRLK